MSMNKLKAKNVIIVGAGPIGLYLSLLLANSVKNVFIVEKRKLPYTRNQIVVFNISIIAKSLQKDLMNNLKEDGICYVDKPFSTLGITCYEQKGNLIACPLNVLETVLCRLTQKHENIKIIRNVNILSIKHQIGTLNYTDNDVEGFNQIKYDILFGADGKNSYVKEKFKNLYAERYIIAEKHNIYGAIYIFKIDPVKLKDIQPAILSNFNHKRIRMFQHKKLGIIYIGLALSAEEYNEIKGNEDKIPNVVHEYLKINDIIIEEKELYCANVFKNKISYCENCYFKSARNYHFLIGDSCFNAHFFSGSSLNSHFEVCGGILGILLNNYRLPNGINYYYKHIVGNRRNVNNFILKFKEIDKKNEEIIKQSRKMGIPQKIIDSLSIKELFYLIEK